jgi:hypothetical protein
VAAIAQIGARTLPAHGIASIRRITGSSLWVPESRLTSCDLLILVKQAADPVPPSDGVRLGRHPLGEWS